MHWSDHDKTTTYSVIFYNILWMNSGVWNKFEEKSHTKWVLIECLMSWFKNSVDFGSDNDFKSIYIKINRWKWKKE